MRSAAMRIVTLSSPLGADRSFRIALGAVVIFAAAEFFAAGYHFIGRGRVVAAPPPPSAEARVAVTKPAPPPAPSIPATITTPPPLSLSEQGLIDAVALRDRGDTANALAR